MSSASAALLQSPLHAEHLRLGARMVAFGGWEMPVQFSSILEEHQAVRTASGVFDISHMGEIFVSGPGAAAWLNRVLSNDIRLLGIGEGHYTFLLNEQGGVIDDLFAYQHAPGEFLLVVNAAKVAEDFAWLRIHLAAGVACVNRSGQFAALAIQGPQAAAVLEKMEPDILLPRRHGIVSAGIAGTQTLLARTGYTGEDGFELFLPSESAVRLWRAALAAGAKPCGLGARDTLRLEVCYPLNGADLTPDHSPLEAGLGIFVAFDKGDFIGRDALLRQKKEGPARRLAAFKMTEKSPPPRAHYAVYHKGERVGEITSATLSPSLGTGIGMAYLPAALAGPGTEIFVEIRGRQFAARVEKKPLYRRHDAAASLQTVPHLA